MDGRGRYGLACTNCFVAKCKCVSRPEGDGCQRCHRLQKHCYASDSVRKRKAQKNTNSVARIAQLESKLDSLVSILGTLPPSPITAAIHQTLHGDDPRPGPGANPLDHCHSLSSGSTSSIATPPSPIGLPRDLTTQDWPPNSRPLPGFHTAASPPSASELDASLTTFREQMLRFCPFIEFAPDVTARQLQRERPFLVQAIVAVTARSVELRRARGRDLKARLGQMMVVENSSTIDLLLAILTYVTWGNDQVVTRSSTLSRLMQLAMSVVYDLRLNKPLPPDVHMLTTAGLQPIGAGEDTGGSDERALEVERATLACFLLSSFVSTYFAQIDALRWTPQMEEFLYRVETNTQCPSDAVLAFQVRLQMIAQKAVQVRDQHDTDLPIAFCTKALSAQLQDLKIHMSPELEKNELLLAQLHYVELSIHETAYTANSDPLLPPSPRSVGSSTLPSWERLGCLWQSLEAIQAWVDVYYRINPTEYVGFTVLMWAQLSRILVTLYRLSTRVDPAWDRRAVSKTVDFLEVADRITDRLEQVCSEQDAPASDDIWLHIGRLSRAVRTWVRLQMGRDRPEELPAWPGETPASTDTFMGDMDANLLQSIDFGNENWLESLVGWSPDRFN
ncbi:hypothetical protein BO71DRAFT_177541 [Aspergillus ellipticus CBS 707.79]|uniref:Zn(2)-C6 fungal-type domain-containing protein n=1 Tax=Aspergillus ellipticus CBS 707.79 TaxID=1448320 RepID=A0A319CQD3_9EURO|nr:hypothetical protein BO71DRAFT_177541 [Aspergillus ellipticus CBS 707.79]